MDLVITFFQSYYREVLAALGFVVSFITTILGVKRANKSSAFCVLLENIPTLIETANSSLGAKTGPAKLEFVLSVIQQYCVKKHLNYDRNYFVDNIESILSADKSKEVQSETKSSSQRQRPSYIFQDGKQDQKS